jgi:hypothetical protein
MSRLPLGTLVPVLLVLPFLAPGRPAAPSGSAPAPALEGGVIVSGPSCVVESVTGGPAAGSRTACGCNDVGDLTNRLKGLEAVLEELEAQRQGPASRGTFDASTFDDGLGTAILTAQMTRGGMGSILVADIDRSSCEVSTGADLAGMEGVPAGLGGSACLIEAVTAQLDVRRKECLAAQTPSTQGHDYWEGRRMSGVMRELTDAYTAEAGFIRERLAGLRPTCGGPGPAPRATRPKATCTNCLQYILEGTRTMPVVGRMRMFSDSRIPFTVKPDGTIEGGGTILTELDMSGSSCSVSGYDGVAEILVSGRISGGYLDATVVPKGASQRVSAAMKITCGDGWAQSIPQQQDYSITQRLKVPGPGDPYSEETIDLGARTLGAMQGSIVLRLYLSQ